MIIIQQLPRASKLLLKLKLLPTPFMQWYLVLYEEADHKEVT
jgi:hypothetical protein